MLRLKEGTARAVSVRSSVGILGLNDLSFIEALAIPIPAAEINKDVLRSQFSQLNIQLQQRRKNSIGPPGCQTKGSCVATWSYSVLGLSV